ACLRRRWCARADAAPPPREPEARMIAGQRRDAAVLAVLCQDSSGRLAKQKLQLSGSRAYDESSLGLGWLSPHNREITCSCDRNRFSPPNFSTTQPGGLMYKFLVFLICAFTFGSVLAGA